MAEAMAGDAVSSTASGRLMAIENRKPSSTVLRVATECQNTVGPMASVSFQIALGGGTR